ncbi:MAG: tyrosine-type recombinase/integrase [Muribaculaceae bacterium]|nr:tyrosine-type recombinase/integrase [Muribaculaceae bacterium]
MNEVIEEYITYMRYELNRSAHTVSAYRADVESFVGWLCEERQSTEVELGQITQRDIRRWMVELQERKVSPRSVRRKLQALRSLFLWGIKRGMIATDPSRKLALPKFESRLPEWVRPEVLDAIIDDDSVEDASDLRHTRDKLIIQLFYETGIRSEELITLRDADVSLSRAEIKVLGKRNKERVIPIGGLLLKAMQEYRAMRDATTGTAERFFVLDSGEPLYPMYVYRIVRQALADAGQPGKSPHKLRHSFASAMLNGGAEINSVKDLLGHASLAATQIYTHISVSELKNNYQQAHPRADKKRR